MKVRVYIKVEAAEGDYSRFVELFSSNFGLQKTE